MDTRPELQIDRQAPVERTALGDGSSWVDVRRGFLRNPDDVFETTIEQTEWMQGEVWRYEKFVEERRLGAWIGRDALTPAFRQTELHLESVYRVRFEGVSAILYRDGNDFQGLHADRQMKWLDETLVAILVLGERRPFTLRPKGDWTAPADRRDDSNDVVLSPGRGDMIVLGGRSQRDWLHGVPSHDTPNPRISVTWRWTSRRGRPDTAPAYNDGVHYSDRPRGAGHRFRRID